jgi:3-deoxy-manno-octulosonate cytidylyltransferase (CMP-KDO synthetase)
MKIACIIPARLKSTRFPKKMLSYLKGKPLLQWVWEAAQKVPEFSTVAFAIDSEETANILRTFGAKYYMTSEECASGTDRLIEVMKQNVIEADIWVNWQGDEPFINAQMIKDLLQSCGSEPSDVWTLRKKIVSLEEIGSPQVAKIVCDNKGFALYFSRSTIPYYRDEKDDSKKTFYKHVGIYAYTTDALNKIATFSPSYLEQAEQLEQLRFLSNNLRIRAHETPHDVFGIDLPEHLVKAEKRMELESRSL